VDTENLDKVKDFILTFTSIFYEALPFVVLGATLGGILQEYLPQRLVTRVLPRNRVLAVALGGLLGLIFPMCECGIIPVMRRLLRKGLPLSCCLAYLLAGPIINVVVISATFVAFSGGRPDAYADPRLAAQMNGWWMTGLRVGLGYLVAIGASLVVEWQHRRYGNSLLMPIAQQDAEVEEKEGAPSKPLFQRLGNISEIALHDFIDIAAFLLLGALMAAGVRLFVTNEQIGVWSAGRPMLSIIIMMVFAVIVTLCSEADAFVAASFTTLRPAAKLAFMVLGPMLDLKLIFMYMRVFRRRLIWTIITAVVLQVFVYSFAVHYLWENFGPAQSRPVPTAPVPSRTTAGPEQ
jgi:uncharacterized membrane protein YraQ (UPF0718 family)